MTTSILSPSSIADPNLLKKSCYFPPTLLTPTPTVSLMTRRKLSNSSATSERPIGLSDIVKGEMTLLDLPSVLDDAPMNVSIIPSSSLHDVPHGTSSHSVAAPTTPLNNSTNSPTRSIADAGFNGTKGPKTGASERDFWSSKMRLPTPFPEKKEGWLGSDSDEDSVVDEMADTSIASNAGAEGERAGKEGSA